MLAGERTPFHDLSIELDNHIEACEEDAARLGAKARNGAKSAVESVEVALSIVRALRWAVREFLPVPPDVGYYRANPRKALVHLQRWCEKAQRAVSIGYLQPNYTLEYFDFERALKALESVLKERRGKRKPRKAWQRRDWDEIDRIYKGWDRAKYRTVANYAHEIDMPVNDVRKAIDLGRKGPPKTWKGVKS